MSDQAGGPGTIPEAGAATTAQYYKRDYWNAESTKFSRPWYRVQKTAQLVSRLAGDRSCTLLDVGCSAAALRQVLRPGIEYYGIDIAIQEPAPWLIEADLLQTPIAFGDRTFDLVVAQGFFEYMADAQSQKFAEIAGLMNKGGKFVVTYTNFGHRRKHVFEAFSNVQPVSDFRRDLERHFTVDRCFPASHNWKHAQPDKALVQAVNMRISANIPVVSPMLAVDYFFVCSARGARG
jgi:SAM-dependent methyltransferase